MPRIKAGNFNAAKKYLAGQGSMTAAKTHPIHKNEKDCPEFYGKGLLAGAQADFASHEDQGAGILLAAANLMGIAWP